MVADGLAGEAEAGGELGGCRAGGHGGEDVALARGQVRERVWWGAARDQGRELACDRGADDRPAGVNAADDVEDLLLLGSLDDVAAGAGAEGLDDYVVFVEHGHHDDADVWSCVADARGRFGAIHSGHGKVHQHHVGLEVERRRDCARAVGCRSAYLEVFD